MQTKNPMYKKIKICKYTPEGREEIHKNLKFSKTVISVMHLLSKEQLYDKSIEYYDNRISLFAAQYGKCAITGNYLQDFDKKFRNESFLTGSMTREEAGNQRALQYVRTLPVNSYSELDKARESLIDFLPEVGITLEQATSANSYLDSCEFNETMGTRCC